MEPCDLKNMSLFKSYSFKTNELAGKISNLMTNCGDVLLLWDKDQGCLLTQGIRSFCIKHQELWPTKQPEFEVFNVTVNDSGSRVALWGPQGVAVMDLPWRCGPRLEYQDGKEKIITRCRIIEDLDLSFDSEVVQVRWNPASVNDSALVVLSSDNSLYHFDMMPPNYLNIETLQLGNRPISRHRTLAALGEIAVDFCFVPIFVETDEKKAGATVLLVLRGNGDVNLVYGDSEGEISPEGQPLPISPLPDDNYLNDACAILTIPGRPTGVVLATTRGVLYHALLMPLDVDQVDVPIRRRKHRLLVVESVVLDLNMFVVPEDLTASPLRLMIDPMHPRRYFVIHSSGVHIVFMEVLTGLEELLKNPSSDSSPNKKLPESTVESLICTTRVILGSVIISSDLVVIDGENNVTSVPLRRIELTPFQLFSPEDESATQQGPLVMQLRQPFQQQVEQMLKESRVLPHVHIPQDGISGEQMLALIVRIGDLVRKITIPRFRQVRSLLAHRIQLIYSMRALQLKEMENLESERNNIKIAAEEFADRVQTVSDELEIQRERVQRVVRLVAESNPTPTDAELRMQGTVSDVEELLQGYIERLERLKKSQAYQVMKIEEKPEKPDGALSNRQVTIIRNGLAVIGDNIAQLVRRVNDLNDMVGLELD